VDWNTTQFLILGGTGRRPFKRVIKTAATNVVIINILSLRKNLELWFFSGVSKNLGLPKTCNGYGNRGLVLAQFIEWRGPANIQRPQTRCLKLKELASGSHEFPKCMSSCNKLKSNFAYDTWWITNILTIYQRN